jgi:sugar-specific transcriptional regulator TrmB
MNIEQGLINWGLTDKEASIYNSLTGRVESTAYQLAQSTKIPKTTIYEILDRLINLGLVSSNRKNGVKYFVAESPNRLTKILEEKMLITKELIPLLLSAPRKGATPTVKLYLGSSGKNKVLEDRERPLR